MHIVGNELRESTFHATQHQVLGHLSGKKPQGMAVRLVMLCLGLFGLALAGCGGSSIQDFALEVAPAAINVVPGGALQKLTVSALPVNGFSGTVEVTVGPLPKGVTASPASLSLAAGSEGEFSIAASSSATAGAAKIAVSATSGKQTHDASAAVTVVQTVAEAAPDFSLDVKPASLTVTPGGAAQVFTVGASQVNGFTGTVAVSLGKLPAGVTASPMSVSVKAGGVAEITVKASGSATAGKASLVLTGSSGGVTHSASAAVTVAEAAPAPDFSLEVAPASITLNPGGLIEVLTVGVKPANGFNGVVSLSVGTLPAGVIASPMTIAIPPGRLAQIAFRASPTATVGTVSLPLTGTYGTLAHSVSASLTVTAPLPAPDFSLEVAPSAISVSPGGPPETVTIGVKPINGFNGIATISVGALPAGVTTSASKFTLAAGAFVQLPIAASSSAAAGSGAITFTGTAGSLTHTGSTELTVTASSGTTTAALSGSAFDFGNDLVNNTLSKTAVVVTNTGTNALTLKPAISGDPSFSIVTAYSCGSQLAAGASCNVIVNYDPTVASAPNVQTATLNLGFANVPAGTPKTVTLTGTSTALAPGVVTATDNPQVALYTMTLPFPGSVTVNFGKTTAYGYKTWTQSTDAAGGQVSILVAGMLAATPYHMQASVEFANGLSAKDVDHVFTTKTYPASMVISLDVATAAGMTPQPGIEMLDPIDDPNGVLFTDLAGNVLWTYANPGDRTEFIDGVKMLPDGNLLMTIGVNSSVPLVAPIGAAEIIEMREVNLAGDTVRELSIQDLNAALLMANCAECNVVLDDFHHDVEPLPNGHWLLLSNTTRALSPTSTPPLTNAPAQTVLGDVIVDVDENGKPVWVWNEFNHLDPNRHPFMFPDWTHTNALVYSPDDGNIVVSIRHQNWVVKVDYANGTGKGDILWHLGEGGDLALKGGTDPVDWQYAQHAPSFTSANTSGVFSMTLMDNGDDRQFPAGVTCGTTGEPVCYYSTIPIFQIDETAKTATLTFHEILPPSLYSFFGGNSEMLANGNLEYDLAGVGAALGDGSWVYEVTDQATPQTVWSMHMTAGNLYRAMRFPSFYPGVQW